MPRILARSFNVATPLLERMRDQAPPDPAASAAAKGVASSFRAHFQAISDPSIVHSRLIAVLAQGLINLDEGRPGGHADPQS
jgi:hypothetical protein